MSNANSNHSTYIFIVFGIFWTIGGFISGIKDGHGLFEAGVLAVPGLGLAIGGIWCLLGKDKNE